MQRQSYHQPPHPPQYKLVLLIMQNNPHLLVLRAAITRTPQWHGWKSCVHSARQYSLMQNSICCNRSVLRASYNCVFNLYVHCRLMGSLNELSYASHHISNSKWSYAMHAAIQCVVIYWWSSQNNITIGRCRSILQHGYFKTNSKRCHMSLYNVILL